jgi:multidrug transporter EmrE-like cation transporter
MYFIGFQTDSDASDIYDQGLAPMNLSRLLMSWGMLILSVTLNAYSVFLIKRRLNELGEIQLDSIRFIFNYGMEFLKSTGALIGIVFFIVAPFFFAVAVSRMEITVAYPVQLGLNFMMVMLLGLIYLGEGFTLDKGIGLCMALGSIYFLAR